MKELTFEIAKKVFVDYLIANGYKKASIKNHESGLKKFFPFLKERMDVFEFPVDDFRSEPLHNVLVFRKPADNS